MTGNTTHKKMRTFHRYLGFFLAGIMLVYSVSGIILIFRDTDFLKQEKIIDKQLQPGLTTEALGKAIHINDLKITATNGAVQNFKQGTYNTVTGAASYTVRSLPKMLQRLTQLHKASTNDPLFFLNIFFGLSLLFFVVSSFWMFMPKTSIFKKGLYFTTAGVLLVVLMLIWG